VAVEVAIALVSHVFDTNLHDYSKMAEAPSCTLLFVLLLLSERSGRRRCASAKFYGALNVCIQNVGTYEQLPTIRFGWAPSLQPKEGL